MRPAHTRVRSGHDGALAAVAEPPGLVGPDERDAVEDRLHRVAAVHAAGGIDGHRRLEPALAHRVDMIDLGAPGHCLQRVQVA